MNEPYAVEWRPVAIISASQFFPDWNPLGQHLDVFETTEWSSV